MKYLLADGVSMSILSEREQEERDRARLSARVEHLKDKGYVDREANKSTNFTFSQTADDQGYYGYIYPDVGTGYICEALRYAPNFVLDVVLVHECAHVTKTYYYGGDMTDYHGPLFQKYNHIPLRYLRLCLEFVCYLYGSAINSSKHRFKHN